MTKTHHPAAVIYVRGTAPEDVNEQLRDCIRYCETELDHTWIDERHARRAYTDTIKPGRGTVLVNRRRSDSTGIRIERDWSRQQQQAGRRRALETVEAFAGNNIDVVIPTVDTIARNHKHIDELLSLLEAGCAIHVVTDGITLRTATDATTDILELRTGLYTERERPDPVETTRSPGTPAEDVELEFADPAADADGALEATTRADSKDETEGEVNDAVEITLPVRREYEGGRPPKGFDISGDELVSNDHYLTIHDVVQAFRDGEISKRKAAEKLDVSRATITNLADRTELYQLA